MGNWIAIGGISEPLPSLMSGGGAGGGKASVIVDFRNMPRGTRTETRADSDTDLEVMTGYAMPGAH